ncbi:alkanesulfonate monooxygenase SsuD/methylene tetrahydromethanopterin reductase-like flavin-dependent oxidoreductase (luciferase family) [Bradyrhizobium sp. GM0.4]
MTRSSTIRLLASSPTPARSTRSTISASNFRVRGPLNISRAPQGRPVYVQAGSSDDGRAFAARFAEAIFTAHQTLESATAFYADIKRQARTFDRSPDEIKILRRHQPLHRQHAG